MDFLTLSSLTNLIERQQPPKKFKKKKILRSLIESNGFYCCVNFHCKCWYIRHRFSAHNDQDLLLIQRTRIPPAAVLLMNPCTSLFPGKYDKIGPTVCS